MGISFFFDWEPVFMQWMQSHANVFFTFLASLASECGDMYVLVAILGFLYWGYDKEYGKYIFTNLAPVQVYPPLLKDIVCRLRPYMVHPEIACLKPVHKDYDIMDIAAQGYSFPSMHSASSTAVYGSLSMYPGTYDRLPHKGHRKYKKSYLWLTIISIIMPLIVGWSRIYTGNHYPSDVVAGLAFGAIAIFVMGFVQKKVSNRKLIYLAVVIIGFPGVFFCTGNDYYTSYGLIIGSFLGFIFEEKYVKFRNTEKVLLLISRTLCGAITFVVINKLLEVPFSEAFLNSGTKLALLVRLFRYTICGFVAMGVYPLLFRLEEKLNKH